MRSAIVKLGGSTIGRPELRGWIEAILSATFPLVVVPGGGLFADRVRQEQQRLRFSDHAAHAMAILAMEQFAHILLDWNERFAPAHDPEGFRSIWRAGRVPVWLASRMTLSASDIPASWDITSDSLAAWLSGRIEADALVLIKQTDAAADGDDLAGLSRRGIVDPAFPGMIPQGIALHVASPRHLGNAEASFAKGKLPGVRIARSSEPQRKAG